MAGLMEEQRWDYCHVELYNPEDPFDPGEDKSPFYVMYWNHPIHGVERMRLMEENEHEPGPWEFSRIVAVLGQIGWEMVSVIHMNGADYFAEGGSTGKRLIGVTTSWSFVAYFKRPITPDSSTANLTGFGMVRVDPLPN